MMRDSEWGHSIALEQPPAVVLLPIVLKELGINPGHPTCNIYTHLVESSLWSLMIPCAKHPEILAHIPDLPQPTLCLKTHIYHMEMD